MQHSKVLPAKPKLYRESHLEIGDAVCLLANPQWVGVVVAVSLSDNVSVRWDNHGIERVDSRLLRLVRPHS